MRATRAHPGGLIFSFPLLSLPQKHRKPINLLYPFLFSIAFAFLYVLTFSSLSFFSHSALNEQRKQQFNDNLR